MTKDSSKCQYAQSIKPLSALAAVLFFTTSTLLQAAPANTYTPGKPLIFEDGTAQIRQGLAKYPELADLVEGRFSIANADFNDDGRVEFILMGADSNFCGSGGCQTYVVEFAANKTIHVLMTAYFGGEVAMTNEKVNGYRALASVYEGKIDIANKRDTPMHAVLHGKQIVYPMSVTETKKTIKPKK